MKVKATIETNTVGGIITSIDTFDTESKEDGEKFLSLLEKTASHEETFIKIVIERI